MTNEREAVPQVETVDLGRRVPGSSESWLFRNLTFMIRPGERIALSGPIGAGKSLLLRSLATLDPADSGSVLWQGRTVSNVEVTTFRSAVTYVAQHPAFQEGTLEANLRLPFTFAVHRDIDFDRDRVVGWLNRLQLDEGILQHQTSDLSGGERQIAALLRSLQLDPQLLLLDEPTAAMDAPTRLAVEEILLDWVDADRDRSWVLVSHDAEQLRRLCVRFLTLTADGLSEEATDDGH